MNERAPPHPRRTLAGIVALLTLPFVVAGGLFVGGWHPARTANHGELIVPPTAIAAPGTWAEKWSPQGSPQWSLILLHDAPCGAACTARLDELRRLRVALGRDMGLTRVVWLGQGVADEAAARRGQLRDIAAVDGRAEAFSNLPPGSLLLLDPQGRAVLRYPPQAPAGDLHRDLERLLKTSWRP